MANNIVVPNEGKTKFLDWALKGGSHEDYVIDIFKSNTTPGDASTAADFTIADYPGYAQQAITAASWGASTVVSNQANSVNTGSPWSFVRSSGAGSPQDTYGWIIRGASSGKVLLAARFSATRTFASVGDTVTIDIPVDLATLV